MGIFWALSIGFWKALAAGFFLTRRRAFGLRVDDRLLGDGGGGLLLDGGCRFIGADELLVDVTSRLLLHPADWLGSDGRLASRFLLHRDWLVMDGRLATSASGTATLAKGLKQLSRRRWHMSNVWHQ